MADIAVELILLPTEQGGRRIPVDQGYRPFFYYNNSDWEALYEYEISGVVPQARPIVARLTFRNPQDHWGKLFVGMPFLLRESNHVVGYGRVTALLDLEASARNARDAAEPTSITEGVLRPSSIVGQLPARVSPAVNMPLGGRRARQRSLLRQRDEWFASLLQQVEQLRIWFDACGCSRFTQFVTRQAEKLSIWFDTSWKRFDDTEFLRQQSKKLRAGSAGIARRLSVVIGWCSRPLLIGWCGFAAALLILSFLLHSSTFLKIDLMAKWPGVMFVHLAIFLPFFAAIYYASRIGGKGPEGQDRVFKSAPKWLRILTGVFFVYAFVNFALFIILIEGGNPYQQDGKFFFKSHSNVIREISAGEYHRQQSYVLRGFSGHWMMFSCAALTGLLGSLRLRNRASGTLEPKSVRLG